MSDSIKYLLEENKAPKFWYNINADLPSPPPPPLHPGTKQPAGPDDFAPLFPMSLIMQEVSTEREIEIPEPVREVYKQWRPSPLFRARRLEKFLDTPAKIYYKYEVLVLQEVTNQILQFRKHFLIKKKELVKFLLKRAQVSGEVH